VVTQVDPTSIAGKHGRRAPSGLRAPTVQERAAAVRRLRASGTTQMLRVDLAGADLIGADLRAIVLDGGSLRGANCQGTDFSNASLLNVDVAQADFSGAKLVGTNPSFIVGWAAAKCDAKTVMPAGWSCSASHPVLAKPAGE
jgi:hypothetical protein